MSIPGRKQYQKAHFRIACQLDELPPRFAVLTACNPNGTIHSEEENASRTRELSEALLAAALPHFAVTGFDPDSGHAEPGFAVDCDADTALKLARRWEQEAIFLIDEDALTLVSCGPTEEKEHVGWWHERVVREYP